MTSVPKRAHFSHREDRAVELGWHLQVPNRPPETDPQSRAQPVVCNDLRQGRGFVGDSGLQVGAGIFSTKQGRRQRPGLNAWATGRRVTGASGTRTESNGARSVGHNYLHTSALSSLQGTQVPYPLHLKCLVGRANTSCDARKGSGSETRSNERRRTADGTKGALLTSWSFIGGDIK
jgi:hypothetical protein